MTELAQVAQDGGQAPIRVLIADDHAVVREGLRTFLEVAGDVQVVGEARNGREAVEKARALGPEVVLMDLVMPEVDGVEAIRRLREEGLTAQVLVLTSFAEDEKILAAVQAGATGYLLKDVAPDELVRAIREAHRGRTQLHPEVARRLLEQVKSAGPGLAAGAGGLAPGEGGPAVGAHPPGAAGSTPVGGPGGYAGGYGGGHAGGRPLNPASIATPTGERLSEREIEVLRLIAKGLSNREIASKLYVTERTVKGHVSNILAKLGLSDRTQAALYAVRHGLAALD